MIKTSKDIYNEIYDIQTAYLLNVSPFILNMVSAYIEDSIQDKGNSIAGLLRTNREIARKEFEGTKLKLLEPKAEVSVAWLEITDTRINATKLQKRIYEEARVYVLPGTYFFWDDRKKGERFLRIALARDTALFTKAIEAMKTVITTL